MIDLEIRKLIANYIAEEIPAAGLADRLEDLAWDLEEEPARGVAAAALLLLSEHENGDWTDEELRERLGAISRMYWFDQAPKQAFAEASGDVIQQVQLSAGSERRRVVASV